MRAASTGASRRIPCTPDPMTMLAERCFDVLVVDVNLPDMNGMAIGELACERYQDRIMILVITGLHIPHRRLSSLQLGADDFLGKTVRSL